MDYFDELFPGRWREDEISDYDKYNSYYNATYKNMLFSKIQKSGSNIIRIDEILLLDEQQTGGKLAKIKDGCKFLREPRCL